MWASKMIDTKGKCAFCLRMANANISKSLNNFEDCWPHLQIKDRDGSSPSFVNKGSVTKIPPICKTCINPAEEVRKCHHDIIDLEEKLGRLRKQLDAAVTLLRTNIHGAQMRRSSSKFSEDTLKFLNSFVEHKDYPKTKDVSIKLEKLEYPTIPRTPSLTVSEVKMNENLQAQTQPMFLVPDVGFDDDPGPNFEMNENSASDSETEPEISNPKRRKIFLRDSEPEDELEDNTHEDEDERPSNSKGKLKPKDPLWTPGPSSKSRKFTKVRKIHNNFSCMVCKEQITLDTNYEHMKSHVGDYVHLCPGCKLAFPSRFSATLFEKHYNKDRMVCKLAPSKQIICEICGEDLTGGNHVSRHFDKHETQEKNYDCPLPSCDASFTHRQTVEYHLRIHEPRQVMKMEGKRKSYKSKSKKEGGIQDRLCEFCREPLPISRALMLEHMQFHVGDYAYQCPSEKCGRAFTSRYSQCFWNYAHVKSCKFLASETVTCDTCGMNITAGNNIKLRRLGEHLKSHETSEKNFHCPVVTCGESFTTRQSVEFHLRTHRAISMQMKEIQTCSLCDCEASSSSKEEMTPSQMETHLMEVHQLQEQDIIKCRDPDCSFVFPNQDDLLDHKIAVHMTSGNVTCDICDSEEIFTHARSLKTHYFKEHQIGTKFLCEFCDKTLSNLHTLQNHIQNAHTNEGCRYKCDICGQNSTSSWGLESHKIKKHDAEPLKCRFCDETFNNRSALSGHEKYEHLGVERPTFPCSKCPTILASTKSLRNHFRSLHVNMTANLKCPECDKMFKTEQSRSRHMKLEHDPSLRRICDLCGKMLKSPHHLQVHMRIHTGERPYQCPLCGMRFRQKASLFNHNKSHKRMGDKFVPKKTFDRTPNY